MGLIKITTPADGFPFEANQVLAKKCNIYIAKGTFDTEDIPDSASELTALYSGTGAKFVPFGDSEGGSSNLTWTQKTKKLAFSTVGLGYSIAGKIVNVTVCKDMFAFIGDLTTGMYSLLFVPDGDTKTFFALNGVSITTEGDIPLDKDDDVAKITFTLSRDVDKLADVVKYDVLSV